MDEEYLEEPKVETQEAATPSKGSRRYSKRRRDYYEGNDSRDEKRMRGRLLAFQKPSYCLRKGIGDIQCGEERQRAHHRKRLWQFLQQFIRQQNWTDASGVLSVYLLATAREDSVAGNRAKYTAALEVLSHIRGDALSSRKIQSVYELWMKKIGPLKNWSTKERFAVQLEFILACLQRGSLEDAHQASICLMQERGFSSDPRANLVVGLAFCQLWYSGLPNELQLTELNSSSMHTQPEILFGGMHRPVDYSMENDAPEEGKANSTLQCDSSTSIAIEKVVIRDDGIEQEKEINAVDDNVKKELSDTNYEPEQVYAESVEASDRLESLPEYSDDLPQVSIFHTKGLPPWLLPMKLPSHDEDLEDAIYAHRKLLNNHYKSALKHLRVALHSTPPVKEALHPLVQMLLLGDKVVEALDELENSFQSSDTLVQLRLKASIVEHFDSENYARLCACFEDILNKDPTCADSLRKLTLMHQQGDYDTQSLVEMIALHLDATYGTCDAWKDLASCFLKLSQCEGDSASACYSGNDQNNQESLDTPNKIPDLFTNGESGESWRHRAKYWLNRHFHNSVLTKDIAADDLKVLTYKAALASHIYGRQFRYVLKATEWLEKENEMQLYSFLQMHILNSVGFFFVDTNNT